MTTSDAVPQRSPFLRRFGLILGIFSLGLIAGAGYYWKDRSQQPAEASKTEADFRLPEIPPGTHVRKPQGPAGVNTGALDPHGKPITAACSTCHTTKSPNTDLKVGMDLKTFHQGLKGNHGNLTCVSCHNAGESYQSLRLADGRALPYPDVMQLCAQCHGPQHRDYLKGAHGGMVGHWDLTKGGRVRNNCIDCHDPHAPKYPVVRPAPGPNDRFQHPTQAKPGGGHE